VNPPAHERPQRQLPNDRPRGARPTLGQRFRESKVVTWISAGYVRLAIAFARALGRRRATALSAWFTCLIAPLIRENRIAAANLAAAFPEKSDAERRRILRGVWDNVARTAMEYAFLDEILADFRLHRLDRGPFTATGIEDFLRIREDGKPALIFSAHLANWELPATIAERFRLNLTIMYRMPKNSIVAADLMKVRNDLMGELIPTRFSSALEIADIVANGGHVALLVDQRRTGSPLFPFFGRPALTNVFFAKLARQYDCPVHGVRAIRLPGDRFHVELTPPIDLPRDADGLIDVMAATQKINHIIEGWIREYPEQWLWLHDRWRMTYRTK
jgi:KDO2-lipid IV(A) lauroyltransferase